MFPQIFGKYVLEREIASGGMAVVYLATLRGAGGFEKRLVVKQIRAELASDEAFLRRFVAEAKTTVELSHPNIVPVYELGVEQGVYFIAMELAEGATLAELLQTSGPLSPEEGAYLGVEISRALDYAHRKGGVVHRDVTPRNVLIDEEGAVRLIDFGIAAPVSGEALRKERVFGSPGHMPPEQREGGRLTPATDVFAVAALLLEAWTGRAPFRRATAEESDAALRERPPAPSIKDPGLAPLDDLVARALALDAIDRQQTAEDFARPLRDFLRSADLGDIARRLGRRVSAMRKSLRSGPESSHAPSDAALQSGPTTPAMRTPATPSTKRLDPVTETFASRDEVVEWTTGGSRFPKAIGPDATRHDRATVGGSRARFGFAFLAVLVVSAVVALASKKPAERDLTPAPRPAVAEKRLATSTPATGPSELPVAIPSAAPPTPSAAAPRSAESSAQTVDGVVTLKFTSDLPETSVRVDGQAIGKTGRHPLVLRKAPGKHDVLFTNKDLPGESLPATFVAEAGETVTVMALLSKAEPTVNIRR